MVVLFFFGSFLGFWEVEVLRNRWWVSSRVLFEEELGEGIFVY